MTLSFDETDPKGRQFSIPNIINNYCVRVLKSQNTQMSEYTDVALLIHSLIHFNKKIKFMALDGFLDLMFHHLLYGLTETEEFFVELYSTFFEKAFDHDCMEIKYLTNYLVCYPLFKAFVNHRKGLPYDIQISQIDVLITVHTNVNLEVQHEFDRNQIISVFVIVNQFSRDKFDIFLSKFIPNYRSIIEISEFEAR